MPNGLWTHDAHTIVVRSLLMQIWISSWTWMSEQYWPFNRSSNFTFSQDFYKLFWTPSTDFTGFCQFFWYQLQTYVVKNCEGILNILNGHVMMGNWFAWDATPEQEVGITCWCLVWLAWNHAVLLMAQPW